MIGIVALARAEVVPAPGVTGPVPVEALAATVPPGWTVAVVAQVTRGPWTVVVAWPGMRDGELVDDDIVGFPFRQDTDGTWIAPPGGLALSRRGRPELVQALGGADGWTIARRCGAPAAEIGARANDAAARFDRALAAKDAREAVIAYHDFASLFAFDAVALDDAVVEILRGWTARGVSMVCKDKKKPTCAVEPGGVPLVVTPCGDGFVVEPPRG